jgi:hypothetical protein
MTREEFDRRQWAFEDELKSKGLDAIDIARSCWWCRDTSQCDETCSKPETLVAC